MGTSYSADVERIEEILGEYAWEKHLRREGQIVQTLMVGTAPSRTREYQSNCPLVSVCRRPQLGA